MSSAVSSVIAGAKVDSVHSNLKSDFPRSTVFITGEVNSGKSSFLNAFAGGLVSNVSLQRETFNPIWYQFSHQGTDANLRRISEQLEKVHQSNEKSRRNVESLTEEDVSTTLKITDDENELPVRYELAPLNVIDFPGINDAEDAEKQLFYTAICNRVSEADLVIFVTDAMTAFSKASEIAEFHRIEELVAEENEEGHFVELIIVVNKFDSTDDTDLQEIFKRIFEKLPDFETKKVFRFSSHKMLIDNVIRNKQDLYLPLFNKQELQRILKNCNVQLTPAAMQRIKQEHVLRYSDICIQGDLGDVLPDVDVEEARTVQPSSNAVTPKSDSASSATSQTDNPSNEEAWSQVEKDEDAGADTQQDEDDGEENDNKIDPSAEEDVKEDAFEEEVEVLEYPDGQEGDQLRLLRTRPYYRLIDFLQRFQSQLKEQRLASAKSHLDISWQGLRTICTRHRKIESQIEDVRDSVSALMDLLPRFKSIGAEDQYVDRLLTELRAIGQIRKDNAAYMRIIGDIVKVLLVFIWHNSLATGDNGILTAVLQNAKDFTIDVHQTFAYFFVTQPRHPSFQVTWTEACKNWLMFVGSDPLTFEQVSWNSFRRPQLKDSARFTIDREIQWCPDGKDILMPNISEHPNPVLEHLLHRSAVPIEMRMLLKMAITPLAYLNELDRSKRLPYKVLKDFQPDFLRSLRLLMLHPNLFDQSKPLNHRFFSLSDFFPQVRTHHSFLDEWDLLTWKAPPEAFVDEDVGKDVEKEEVQGAKQ